MTATSASVRFSASGVTGVDAFVRLTGHSYIHCCVYDDIAPILSVRDAHVDISITVPGRDQVTADDLAMARLLAEAAGEYAAELEKFAAKDRPRRPIPVSPGGRRDERLIKAGRPELVPPAAPGFSPACTKEVTSVCAGS